MVINILGDDYNVLVNKKSIKNTYIKIDDHLNIVININKKAREKQIQKTLNENKNSIEKMINKKKKMIIKDSKCFFLGEEYSLIKNNSFFLADHVDKKIYYKKEKEIDIFFEKETKEILKKRYETIYNLNFNELEKPILKFRRMKTRWGVCNKKSKSITLNKELIKRSYEEIDYVIIHEFCHLNVFDHSKKFWDLVSFYIPNYKVIRKKLKD